jgi:phosphoglycerate dehydrogenase-like enzyme
MPTIGRAILVAGGNINAMCDTIAAGVKARGHEIVRYANSTAFREARAPLAEGDVLMALGWPCNRQLLSSAKLRAVVSPYTGTDFIDVGAATELGIVVGHGQTPENTIGMAEANIMLMLECLYDLRRSEKLLRENLPRPDRFARLARGKTLGLIGLGAIARAIIERLAGWEMCIVAYTPRPRPPLPAGVTLVSLEELLASSDVVMVVSSLNAETRGTLDEKRLMSMKRGAIVINTARGEIGDEKALCEAMKRGHLGKIALDVYETEPLPADSPLRALPNAILTPHIVGQPIENIVAAELAAVENIARPLEGRAPLYVRNPEVLPAWRGRWGQVPTQVPR